MTEFEFFSFLLNQTKENKIKWNIPYDNDNDKTKYTIGEIPPEIQLGDELTLYHDKYRLRGNYCQYGDEETRKLAIRIFRYSCSRERLVDDAYKYVNKLISSSKNVKENQEIKEKTNEAI